MTRSAAVLVAVLAVSLLGGCSPEGDPEPAAALSPTTEVTSGPAPAVEAVTVPDVLGLARPAAIRRLRASGLDPQPFWTRGATCAGADMVLRQRPRPGRRLEPGTRVVILTDQVHCGPLRRHSRVDAAATRVADAFARFARGDSARPPRTGPAVALLLGGAPAGRIPASRIGDRRSWRGCSDPRGYAAAGCPVELLGPFIAAGVNRSALDYTQMAPDGVCLVERPGAAYDALLRLDRVVITPTRRAASCASDFRYELFLDQGALVAVNLVLTDP